MSKDIRSFFGVKSSEKGKKEKQNQPKETKSHRKRSIVFSDSDDDVAEDYANKKSVKKQSSDRKKRSPKESKTPRKRSLLFFDSDDGDDHNILDSGSKSTKKNQGTERKKNAKHWDNSCEEEVFKPSTSKKSKLDKDTLPKERLTPNKNERNMRKSDAESRVDKVTTNAKKNAVLPVVVTSKHFKDVKANDLFASEPVKRITRKSLRLTPKKEEVNEKELLADDAAFLETLNQLDDVGENWISFDKESNAIDEGNTKLKAGCKVVTESNSAKDKSHMSLNNGVDGISTSSKNSKLAEASPSKKTNKNKTNRDTTGKVELNSLADEGISITNGEQLNREGSLFEIESLSKSLEGNQESTSGRKKRAVSKTTVKDKEVAIIETHAISKSPNKKVRSPTAVDVDSGYFAETPTLDSGYDENSEKTAALKRTVSECQITVAETKKPSKLSELSLVTKKTAKKSPKAETAAPPSYPTESTDSGVISLWVEKHKPQSSNKIIGQQGANSNVNKLVNWLKSWFKNNSGKRKGGYAPGGWAKDPTGACFKAALLSGPPGVGKTTTVSLVCSELKFDMVEFNASDTRSKKMLQEVTDLLSSQSFNSTNAGGCKLSNMRVLVMDEVDGMAGNEDRGGVQELIQFIKSSKIPIICMCNDRNHPKIRSLANYCFDLRFHRPRLEQIKGYMMSVCYKENLKISGNVLTDIITSANNDIRLTLNYLSMLAAKNTTDMETYKKYVKLGPWDVVRKVFTEEDRRQMTIHDKLDLFFYDYSIAPLFVQENYLIVKPHRTKGKRETLETFAEAAESISWGDLIDKKIRSNNSWSLLPTQAVFASYIPGELLEGHCSAQINFPSWLGKNSTQTKISRMLQELQTHTRLRISGSRVDMNLDYAQQLRDYIISPLLADGTDGVRTAYDRLRSYDLLRDDLDGLTEVTTWPNKYDPFSRVDSKVKAAFTRLYNKESPLCPYSLTVATKKGKNDVTDEDFENAEENGSVSSEGEDDAADAMIVSKKKNSKKTSKNEQSTSIEKMKPTKARKTKK